MPLFGTEIEGARRGPNPHHRSRPSYRPILAYVPEIDAWVGLRLRPDDTGFGQGDVAAVRAITRRVREAVGPRCEIVVRMDAAGDCAKPLRMLHREKVFFAIKLHLTASAAGCARRLRHHATEDVLAGRRRRAVRRSERLTVQASWRSVLWTPGRPLALRPCERAARRGRG